MMENKKCLKPPNSQTVPQIPRSCHPQIQCSHVEKSPGALHHGAMPLWAGNPLHRDSLTLHHMAG